MPVKAYFLWRTLSEAHYDFYLVCSSVRNWIKIYFVLEREIMQLISLIDHNSELVEQKVCNHY